MSKAICNLSIIPLRAEASHRSEMVSQILFGEEFEILEESQDFVHIQTRLPRYNGWIQKHQFVFSELENNAFEYLVDVGGAQAISEKNIINLIHGTKINHDFVIAGPDKYHIVGNIRQVNLNDFDDEIIKLVAHYNNSPYLWGGRSNFGIDCSGLSQVVYAHFGIQLARDAYQQAEQGQVVDFLTEIKPGDLAFFDNEAGKITHVGIMLDNQHIFHASTKVRIDKLDNEGIFNTDLNRYSHKLRIVKRYF